MGDFLVPIALFSLLIYLIFKFIQLIVSVKKALVRKIKNRKMSKSMARLRQDVGFQQKKTVQPNKSGIKQRFEQIRDFCELKDVVFLDTETTGLSDTDQVVEIAIVDLYGNILMNTLVKPSVKMGREAQKITGITRRELRSAPTWPQVYDDYLIATEGKVIIAYNAKFDKRIIQQTCKAYKMVNKRRKWDCLMDVYSWFLGKTKRGFFINHKLTNAADNCGVVVRNGEHNAHRAVYDCGLSVDVFRYVSSFVLDYYEKSRPPKA